MKLISAQVLITEKLLWEKDEVFSAMRIVDRFTSPAIPPSMERSNIQMYVLGLARYLGPADTGSHIIHYELIRPSGEAKIVGEQHSFSFSDAGEFNTVGINFPIMFHVAPREEGVHYVVLKIDDVEMARALFTLVLPQPEEHKS